METSVDQQPGHNRSYFYVPTKKKYLQEFNYSNLRLIPVDSGSNATFLTYAQGKDRWKCGKCRNKFFTNYKELREHKREAHSY